VLYGLRKRRRGFGREVSGERHGLEFFQLFFYRPNRWCKCSTCVECFATELICRPEIPSLSPYARGLIPGFIIDFNEKFVYH
jgi:hypothetical protein